MGNDTAHNNLAHATRLIDELVRCGVDRFFVAPGSRSTPLVAAIAAHPGAQATVHFDERGTAFMALGYGRATGSPAAWVTTSGTAVANGLPAVVEASTDGVPMLLLTADRPAELRGTGANQTIEQAGIFGGYTRWQFDVAAPDAAVEPAALRSLVDQAVYRARRRPAGPVHLNVMFREPLLPGPGAMLPPDVGAGSGGPHTRYSLPDVAPDPSDLRELACRMRRAARGLLVAGRLDGADERAGVLALAEATGWPLLPDVLSGLRLGGAPGAVAYYDALLADDAFRTAHRPDLIVQIGGRITSKRLQQALAAAGADYVVVHPAPSRLDPYHRVTWHVEGSVAPVARRLREHLSEEGPAPEENRWRAMWQKASASFGERLDAALAATVEINEPLVAREVTRRLPPGHALFLAASMPVRDADTFGDPAGSVPPVAANRGASGIDGTVASAAGYALGLRRPATLLIGDLALLHDLNSLAALRSLPVPVCVVVVNNDGGGIFSFLPVARQEARLFEPYFATPHGLTFEAAAAMFGLSYACPGEAAAFCRAYDAAVASGAPALIEVRTRRDENVALHRRLLAP